jgi:hypothetical protein
MTSSLAKKMNVKPGNPIEVINCPTGLKERLALEFADHTLTFAQGELSGVVLIFISNKDQMNRLVFPILPELSGEYPLWLAYPKGTSGVKTDVNRDVLWKLMESAGWGPARIIALDDTWACLWFRKIPK